MGWLLGCMVTEATNVYTVEKHGLLRGGWVGLLGCIVAEAKNVHTVDKCGL